MSERKPSALIEDITECIKHVQSYTANLSFDDFSKILWYRRPAFIISRLLGRPASHIPADVKEGNLQIPWALIKGMRNRLIHAYFGTDLQLVGNVITNELPALENDLKIIYTELTGQNR